jgi:transporter family-2 protein
MQAAANGKFRQNIDSPAWAAFFSICGTFTTAVVAMLLLRPPAPSAAALREAPWWNWIGGPLGALIVLAGAALTQRLGAAAFIALVVGGQLLCSLLLDHYALLGLQQQPITAGRVLGAALVVAGVLCIKYL